MQRRPVFFLTLILVAALFALWLFRDNSQQDDDSMVLTSMETGAPTAPRRMTSAAVMPAATMPISSDDKTYPLLKLVDTLTRNPISGAAVYAVIPGPTKTRSEIGRTNSLGEFNNVDHHDHVLFEVDELRPPIHAEWTHDASFLEPPSTAIIDVPVFSAIDVTTSSIDRSSQLTIEVIPYPEVPNDGSVSGDALAKLQHLRSDIRGYFKLVTELRIVHARIERKAIVADQQFVRILMPHSGRVVVAGESEGFLGRGVLAEIQQGRITEVTLQLSLRPTIQGTVRDAQHRPVPRKAVSIAVKKFYADNDIRVSDESAATIWSQFRGRSGSRALTYLNAQTNDEGVFQIKGVEADEVSASIIEVGFDRAIATRDRPNGDGSFLGLDLVLSKCEPRQIKTTLGGTDLPNIKLAIVQVDPVDEFNTQNPITVSDESATIDASFLSTGVVYSAMIVGRPDIEALQFRIDGRSKLDFELRK